VRVSFRLAPFTLSERVGGHRRRRNPVPGFLLFVLFVAVLVAMLSEVTAR